MNLLYDLPVRSGGVAKATKKEGGIWAAHS